MPVALSNSHSSEMVELFKESCARLAAFSGDQTHGVRFKSDVLPVTYFGRLAHPELRVLTVGLNPSWSEFDDDGILGRSGPGQVVTSLKDCTDGEARMALDLQDRYFSTKRANRRPSKYFDRVESFLGLLGASYYPSDDKSLAAHVDVLTPFATDRGSSIEGADGEIREDGWNRFRRVVNEARAISLMVVIGSGMDSFAEYGKVRWTWNPSGWPGFFSLDSFAGRAFGVIGASNWGGRILNLPTNDANAVLAIKELLDRWNTVLWR